MSRTPQFQLEVVPLVITLLASVSPVFGQAGDPAVEFLTEPRKTFESAGHAKAKGVRLQIEYPQSWSAAEGRHPNVVQNLVSADRFSMCIITVRTWGDLGTLTAADIEEFLTMPGWPQLLFPPPIVVTDAERVTVDTLPASVVRATIETENVGNRIRQETLNYSLLTPEHYILFQFSVGDSADRRAAALQERFSRFERLFHQMAATIVIANTWRDR